MGLYRDYYDYCRHYVDTDTSDIYMDHKRYNDFIRNGGTNFASYWPGLPCYSHKDAKIIGNVTSIRSNWKDSNEGLSISLNLDPTPKGFETLRDICFKTMHSNYGLNWGLGLYLGEKEKTMKLAPKKVIFNEPATIVFWEDGTKTIVKCSEDDEFNPYYGFCAALAKKIYGNNSKIHKILKKAEYHEKKEEPKVWHFTIDVYANAAIIDSCDNVLKYKDVVSNYLADVSTKTRKGHRNGNERRVVTFYGTSKFGDEKYAESIMYRIKADLESYYAVDEVAIAYGPKEKEK